MTRPADDAVDWDQGWAGGAQFVIVQQDTDGVAGDKGFEADNNRDNNDALPRSSPRIYNVTLVGSGNPDGAQGGAHLRRGTAAEIGNAIVMDFPAFAVDIADAATTLQWNAGDLSWGSSLFTGCGPGGVPFPPDGNDVELDEDAELRQQARDNLFDVDPELGDPHSLTHPSFAPAAGSEAVAGGATPPAGLDQTATYRGAIAPGGEDWTTGWTAYPES